MKDAFIGFNRITPKEVAKNPLAEGFDKDTVYFVKEDEEGKTGSILVNGINYSNPLDVTVKNIKSPNTNFIKLSDDIFSMEGVQAGGYLDCDRAEKFDFELEGIKYYGWQLDFIEDYINEPTGLVVYTTDKIPTTESLLYRKVSDEEVTPLNTTIDYVGIIPDKLHINSGLIELNLSSINNSNESASEFTAEKICIDNKLDVRSLLNSELDSLGEEYVDFFKTETDGVNFYIKTTDGTGEETAGIRLDDGGITMWCPTDNYALRFINQDGGSLVFSVDGSGKFTGNQYEGDEEAISTVTMPVGLNDDKVATTKFVHDVIEDELITILDNTNGHAYVDLGLPSGTLWATMNIGATSPEDYGDYFAWGETTTKSDYTWGTYKHGASPASLTKYCTSSSNGTVDNKNVLEPEDDAANIVWGGSWRMPTIDELQELINNCTWTWTRKGGNNGCLVTSKTNGNSIFLPAAGYRNGENGMNLRNAGTSGGYWSASLKESYTVSGRSFSLSSSGSSTGDTYRYNGLSIRPVCVRSSRHKYLPVTDYDDDTFKIGSKESLQGICVTKTSHFPDLKLDSKLEWGGNYGKLTSGTIEANGKITTTGSLTVKGENATKLGGSLTVEGETNFNGEVKFANRISVAEGKGTSLGGSLTVGGYIDADKHALGCGRISAKGEIHGKDALALDAMTTENNSDTDDDPWDYNPVKIGTEHASFRTRKDKERIAFDYTTDGETLISVTDGIKIGEGYLKRTSYGSRLKFVDSDGNYAPIEVSNLYFVQNGSFVSLASFLNNIMSRLEALESK